MQEEREEKALRKAEMEATKATNMLAHEAEILARPKREWFLTPRQKADVAKAAKSEAHGAPSEKEAAAARKAAKSKKDARNADAKGVPFAEWHIVGSCLTAKSERSSGGAARCACATRARARLRRVSGLQAQRRRSKWAPPRRS